MPMGRQLPENLGPPTTLRAFVRDAEVGDTFIVLPEGKVHTFAGVDPDGHIRVLVAIPTRRVPVLDADGNRIGTRPYEEEALWHGSVKVQAVLPDDTNDRGAVA